MVGFGCLQQLVAIYFIPAFCFSIGQSSSIIGYPLYHAAVSFFSSRVTLYLIFPFSDMYRISIVRKVLLSN
jgi:hypothetical protein